MGRLERAARYWRATVPDQAAEAALRALAADLIEELAAARALELSQSVELAEFPVRPFQRIEHTPQGREIPEHVRQHWVQGAPGHMVGNISEAKWLANRWGKLNKLRQDIDTTHTHVASAPVPWGGAHDAAAHLDAAKNRVGAAMGEGGRSDPKALGDAYQHLAEAHRFGVEHALSQADTAEDQAHAREGLTRIQQHMQAIDQVTGTNPKHTAKVLGSHAEQAERAQHSREQRDRAIQQAAEQQKKAADQAQAEQQGLPAPGMPPLRQGAEAVHPMLGGHLVTNLPGDTISGHAHAHVARPAPVQHDTASPEQVALEQAGKRIEGYQKRESQRREADLNDHLSEMRDRERAARGIAAPGTYHPLSDEEFAAHIRQVEDAMDNALDAGLASEYQHTIGNKGYVWNPDRASQHAEIIKDFLEKQTAVPSARKALFMGGLPGAGKSTLLKDHPEISIADYAVINPDDFKTELAKRGMIPELPGIAPMEAATLVHPESVDLANLAAAELERRGKNIAFDVTMSRRSDTGSRLKELKEHGYHVSALFVDVPPKEAARRVESRYRAGLEAYRKGKSPLGAQYVPREVVMAGEYKPGISYARRTFDQFRPQFDHWELYDGTQSPAKLTGKSGQRTTSGIASAEELRRVLNPFTGNTEAAARAAEKGSAK